MSQIAAHLLRVTGFHAIERLVGSGAARGLGVQRRFSEDTLVYFNARLLPERPREALIQVVKRARRNKVFRGHSRIWLAVDGSGADRCGARSEVCRFCRPYHDANGAVVGHRHELAMIAVVGVGMTLPLDVEPYGQGDGELAAGTGLLRRVADALGPRLADYIVADAKYGAASFLNAVTAAGLHAVVRLKDNLSDMHGRAVARFHARPPDQSISYDGTTVELWDDATARGKGLHGPSCACCATDTRRRPARPSTRTG